LVSFDVVSLFTNVPVEKVLEIISNKPVEDDTLEEHRVLEVDAIMVLLEVCLRTTLSSFKQKRGHDNGKLAASSGKQYLHTIFLKTSAKHRATEPSLWLCLQFTGILESYSLRPTIKFTVAVETDSVIPLLDMLIINKGSTMDTKVYRKHTHRHTHTHTLVITIICN
jgi:hypothetical protein